MVTCKLYGRLGNQMSQIAATIGYGVKHNMEYYIPPQSERPADWPCYFPHLVNEIPNFQWLITQEYKEPSQAFHEIPFLQHIRLDGHFPCEKYWSFCRKRVLKAFNIPYNLTKGVVGVHVRRGDYLNHPQIHPVVTEEYLIHAMKYFLVRGYDKFIFFSDDMDWCRTFINSCDSKFIFRQIDKSFDVRFSGNNSPLQDMSLLSSCEHQIISNSTFSMWAAHLNQNPDKIIVAPKIWTHVTPQEWDTSDICPDTWIRL